MVEFQLKHEAENRLKITRKDFEKLKKQFSNENLSHIIFDLEPKKEKSKESKQDPAIQTIISHCIEKNVFESLFEPLSKELKKDDTAMSDDEINKSKEKLKETPDAGCGLGMLFA